MLDFSILFKIGGAGIILVIAAISLFPLLVEKVK